MMIECLIRFLRNAGLDLTAEEVADILWLSGYLPSGQVENIHLSTEFVSGETLIIPPPVMKVIDHRSFISPKPPKIVLPPEIPNDRLTGGMPAISITSPSPPGLTGKRDFIKALRPMALKAQSKNRTELDETITVRQIADQRIWQVFTHPALERPMEIDLVIEESPSMLFWKSVVDELCHLIESTGVFRKVNFWSLITPLADSETDLYVRSHQAISKKPHRHPAELANYSGRKLILLISDCISPIWYSGRINTLLEMWETKSFLSLLHLLPEEMKWRTGLRNAYPTHLHSCRPVRRNTELIVQRPNLWPYSWNQKLIGIPVFRLEPLAVRAWAEFITGISSAWHHGYVFPQTTAYTDLPTEEVPDENDPDAVLKTFRFSSSATAWKLAVYFSVTAPLNLPVMRLIQQSMLPDSKHYHLIEVLMGGILKPLPITNGKPLNTEELRFEFIAGVRERLGNYLPQDLAFDVLSQTSNFVARRTHERITFQALLTEPELVGNIEITPETEEFAWVSADLLMRYGGEYVRLAEKLKLTKAAQKPEQLPFRRVEENMDQLIELTRKLISIPSYLDAETDERQVGEFIYNYLQNLGYFKVEKQSVEGDRFNIIAHDGHPPRLMFCCHMDTVPPSGAWIRGPFAGQVEGERLYGLGACDMKGGTSALLHTLQSFQETRGLFLLFDVDEEYYFKGMLKFLEDYHPHPELVVFPEPGLKIGNGHRGLIEVNFKVRGKTAHAARPDLGKNAILGLSRAVEDLLRKLENYRHPVLGETACNLAWLRGGIDVGDGRLDCRANKIPDLAEAVIDIRPASPDLRARIVLDILEKYLVQNDFQLESPNIALDFGSLYIDPEKLIKFETIVREVVGQVVYDDIKSGGYGEGQLLNERLMADCVYFGPGPKEMAHQVDEYVLISELQQARDTFKMLMEKYGVVS